MREVMSATQARRLRLIELLNEHDGWVHIDYLMDELACSNRTIQSDVENIINLFPNITIESIPKNYRMTFAEGFNMQIVNQKMLDRVPILKLVETMLFRTVESLDDVSDILYTSTASFYRMLGSLNQYLKNKFNIHIKGRPFHLEGDEVDVRFFYSQLFAEKYSVTEWPFKVIEEAPFNDLIHYFMKMVDVPINFAAFRYVKIVTAVNLLRMQSGHYIEDIPEIYHEKYEAVVNDDEFPYYATYFETTFGIETNEVTLYNLFMAFAQPEFFFQYEHLLSATQTNPTIKQSYDFLVQFLNDIQDKYQIQLENFETLLLNIHNTSYLERREIDSTFLLYDRKKYLCEYFEQLNPDIYSDIKKGLIEFRKVNQQSLDEDILHQLIYTLYVYWSHLIIQIEAMKKEIQVVVISEYDPKHMEVCVEMLDYNTSDQIVVEAFKDYMFDREAIKDSHYDIIVSNFYIEPIEGKHTVFFGDVITEEIINEVQFIAHQSLLGNR